MPYSVKGFFEIDEDMVQILLVLEVLFTKDYYPQYSVQFLYTYMPSLTNSQVTLSARAPDKRRVLRIIQR